MNNKHLNNESDVYVLYHGGGCMDGQGARYAAWVKYGTNANYIPVNYGEGFNVNLINPENSEVYILDFSYSREILDDLYTKVKKLVVLDHHKTSEEVLRDTPYSKFDMNKSGAVLAWEYFHPNKDVPKLLKHIQDRDLWKFELSGTKEIMSAFKLKCSDIDNWTDVIRDETVNSLQQLYNEGKIVQLVIEDQVQRTAKKAKYHKLNNGLTFSLVNATENASELGSYICLNTDVDFSVSYFITEEGKVVLSFRSTDDKEDVGAIAKLLGGGGHRNAAGAIVSLEHLDAIINEGNLFNE